MNLKRTTCLLMVLISLFLFTLSSCEKKSVLPTNDNTTLSSNQTYTISNPEWIIYDKNHIDQDGNIGILYVNKKNEIEKLFQIISESKLLKKKWTGTSQTKTITTPDGSYVEYSCSGEPENCYINVVSSGDKVISAEIVYK